jgi:hypothetical protein
MPKPKKNKLEGIESGVYKHIHLQTTLSPIKYKEVVEFMEEYGYNNESAFLRVTIYSFMQKNKGSK